MYRIMSASKDAYITNKIIKIGKKQLSLILNTID